jgi:hypothetical protein
MTQENIPQTHSPEVDENQPVKEAAKTAGRALLWLVIAIAVVLVILGVFFLGPLGLFILLPAIIAIWLAASATAAGPAAGA